MKKQTLTLLALLTLTLMGCVEHKINKGVVVDKSKTHSHVVYNSVNGVLIPIRYPTKYKLTVEDNGIIETFRVSEDVYASFTVGDSIRFGE